MEFLAAYIKQRRGGVIVFVLFCFIFLCIFVMYHLPAEAVLYPMMVCTLLGSLFLFSDFRRAYQKHQDLTAIQKLSAELMEAFPPISSLEDDDYQKIIRILIEEQKQLETRMNTRYSDMIDYYTVWAHQIKTPIASMRLNLQNEDTEISRKVSEDLFRIEQYVEMVLCYLRLDSSSTDYIIKEYDLDDMIKQSVKKFAGQFIRRRIRLVYEPLHVCVLTDEKWMSFVIDQVLSNALKYTETGAITIELEAPKTLCIRDSGIGIAPEDLPRIFEKGYTGYNGRSDKKASGLGLYLCKCICDKLGHKITANSSLDSGTVIRIALEKQRLEVE